MKKRQTKFGLHDVNDARANNRTAILRGGRRAACANRGAARYGCFYRNQQLSWRGFAVCQNVSYRRCKVINARAGHDDAVTAAVSFLRDAQESSAVVFPELDVEVLALNLQFSRLDDVVHFALGARV